MSVGELLSLYRDSEMDIHPEFQRVFRWTLGQKTRFIESLILGIPVPSIFVFQRADGVWEVLDGLQRLSTIFEFFGLLKKEDGALNPPLQLEPTEYLPSLGGKIGSDTSSDSTEFKSILMIIKRAKIPVQILHETTENKVKYELFQRLNSGGSSLSDQETRKCILLMLNRELYDLIERLSEYEHFTNCASISENSENKSYYQELVCRFLVLRKLQNIPAQKLNSDYHGHLTKLLVEFAESEIDIAAEEQNFKECFTLVNANIKPLNFAI
jgi:Protein of unknown function DUF262